MHSNELFCYEKKQLFSCHEHNICFPQTHPNISENDFTAVFVFHHHLLGGWEGNKRLKLLSCDPLQYEYIFDNDFFMAINDIFIQFLYIHFLFALIHVVRPVTNQTENKLSPSIVKLFVFSNTVFGQYFFCYMHSMWNWIFSAFTARKIRVLILLYPGYKFTDLNYHFVSVSSLLIPSPTQKVLSKSGILHVNKIYIELSLYLTWNGRCEHKLSVVWCCLNVLNKLTTLLALMFQVFFFNTQNDINDDNNKWQELFYTFVQEAKW